MSEYLSGMKKKKMTAEHKKSLSISHLGKKQSPETRSKMLVSIKQSITNGKNRVAKLNWVIVRAIRKEYIEENISYVNLGIKYNVNKTTIGLIIRNKTWKE